MRLDSILASWAGVRDEDDEDEEVEEGLATAEGEEVDILGVGGGESGGEGQG